MRETNMGGPAFPNDAPFQPNGVAYHHEGMTLWDYYAAAALAGHMASGAENSTAADAQVAANTADAMLRERRKRMEEPNEAPK